MTKTIVYIDGLNLYYLSLRYTSYKWLDLENLCRATLPHGTNIVSIKYYTARVSGRVDPDAPRRQNAYLSALSTLPLVQVYYGSFRSYRKWAGLVKPPRFKPPSTFSFSADPEVVHVYRAEEKGSDVNLGVHLVRDAFVGAYDEAAVLTNDTDLFEPMRIITEELGKTLTLLTPAPNEAKSLSNIATHVRHVESYISQSQFPQSLVRADGKLILKPNSW